MTLPAITLTDPQNLSSTPSPVLSSISPAKQTTAATPASYASFELKRAASTRVRIVPRDLYGNAIISGRSRSATSREAENMSGRQKSQTRHATVPAHLAGERAQRISPARRDASQESQQDVPVDPLSQRIFERTQGVQPAPSIAPSANSDATSFADDRCSSGVFSAQQAPSIRSTIDASAHRDLKKGVKAVSFLSRLIGSKKKEATVEGATTHDAAPQTDDPRPEGAAASVFAQSVDNLSYSARQAQPPAYIKSRYRHKPKPQFNRLFLAQELSCSKGRKLARTDSNKLRRKGILPPEQDTVWAMEFSRDGRYLAAAGADMVLRVWKVLASPEDRHKHESEESDDRSQERRQWEHLKAPVFRSTPVREYEGHTGTILDLSWSKNNFLLSSSMDKTVRLWHVSRQECLCTFKHNDIVPSVAFHPRDDRFFLAGSLDSRLRLWSVQEKAVSFSTQVPDMITAVAFTPDGKSAMAGCLNGLCMFYDTEGLKYQTQLQVRPTHGATVNGTKITGIQSSYAANGDVKVLITSNDSRARLYNMRDKSLELKFKGNVNGSSQIRARLSDDGKQVVCGSEDGRTHIWSANPAEGETRSKRPEESFSASDRMTTAVCFASSKTRCLLGKSEDPIYDLCNPPTVTLLSSVERSGSQASSRPPTLNGDASPRGGQGDDGGFARPKESASYLTKAAHKHGNIIVTADYSGRIRVFRQDCAWQKRRPEDFDRSSIFGGKRTTSKAGSIATRGSEASLTKLGAQKSSSPQAVSSDRILSWRQGVGTSASRAGASKSDSKRASRSVSPRRSIGQASVSSITPARNHTSTTEPESATSTAPTSLDVGEHADHPHSVATLPDKHVPSPTEHETHTPPSDDPLLFATDARSNVFWDAARWKTHFDHARQVHSKQEIPADIVASRPGSISGSVDGLLAVKPPMNRQASFVSRLSDERSSGEEDEGTFEDAKEGH